MNKLQNEFKLVCAENDELKRRVLEAENNAKRIRSEYEGKTQMMTEEAQRLNNLVEKRNNEIRSLGG